jgi:prolyl 4-hydroxylase
MTIRREQLDGERIFLVHGLLSDEECAASIARSEGMAYERGTVGGEVVDSARNNERVLFDDPALADEMYRRIFAELPSTIEGDVLVGFNERWRFYRYGPGQAFTPHRDGRHTRFKAREESRLTFMVYLNDDVEGGETRFFRGMAEALSGAPWLTVSPRRGTALIFEHALWHEGAVVRAGRKYVLRTDVMYGRPRR